jgi:hypothetical protein
MKGLIAAPARPVGRARWSPRCGALGARLEAMAGAMGRRGEKRPKKYGGWCCHQPPLPWLRSPCLAAWRFRRADRVPAKSCNSVGSFSGLRPSLAASAGPQRNLSKQASTVPFAVLSPEGSGCAGLRRKVGAASAFACASRFFLRSPCRPLIRFHPRGSCRLRSGNDPGMSAVSGRSLLITRTWSHGFRSRT